MDPRSQSSFIPKKPIVMDTRQSRVPMSLFSIVAITIFVITILAAAGAFFYQNYLTGQIASASSNINSEQDEFDPSTIEQLIRLDSRLTVANGILNNHVAISNFFAELEKVTYQAVRFSNFTFAIGDKGALSVTMDGEAEDFSSIALQSDKLIKDTYFSNVVVSNFAVEQSGAVSFTAAFDIAPSLVSYSSAGAPSATSTAQSTGAPPPSSVATSTNNSPTQ